MKGAATVGTGAAFGASCVGKSVATRLVASDVGAALAEKGVGVAVAPGMAVGGGSIIGEKGWSGAGSLPQAANTKAMTRAIMAAMACLVGSSLIGMKRV